MSAYYSTETTITNKITSTRITIWGDKNGDGSIDSAALTQALSWAKARINIMLLRRYGEQVEAWDSDTVPTILSHISDDFTIFYLASGNNAMNPIIQQNYENAENLLQMIRNNELDLPDIDDYDEDILTETIESVFDEFQERFSIKDRGEYYDENESS